MIVSHFAPSLSLKKAGHDQPRARPTLRAETEPGIPAHEAVRFRGASEWKESGGHVKAASSGLESMIGGSMETVDVKGKWRAGQERGPGAAGA